MAETATSATATTTAAAAAAAAVAAAAAAAAPLVDLASEKDFDDLLRSGSRAIIHCWAPWAQPCVQVNAVLEALHTQHTTLTFARVQPEKLPALVARYGIRDVPHLLFVAGGRVARSQTGADAAALTRSATWLADATDDALLTAACETLRGGDSGADTGIVLLIKGSPSSPRCPFSRQMVELLQSRGVVFSHVDVLPDAEVRERMKEVAAWETYPMLFARGRFVGGIDVVTRLAEEGRLVAELARRDDEAAPAVHADEALTGERTGGGGEAGVEKEAAESGAEAGANGAQVPEEERVRSRMEGLCRQADVVLFMKGTPDEPRCGFSRRIVATMREQRVAFQSVDVLSDPEVRSGMKAYSKWPTFPQMYAQGRFVGGLDVVNELVEMGELRTELGLDA